MQAEFVAFWEKHAARRLMGRNMILRSFCPQVFGLYIVKVCA